MSADEKYSVALTLYKTTTKTIKEISKECGVTRDGFASYIYRCHRDLMYIRNGIEPIAVENKIWKSKGQTPMSRKKYQAAIEACDSEKYINLNISQIARLFNLDGTALANQIKSHYPEIIERREKERRRRGIADNFHRGPRTFSVESYSDALKLLESTDMTIEEVADVCNVSFTGLKQHLLLYHKKLVSLRQDKRLKGKLLPKVGKLAGNGTIRKANPQDCEKYSEAVELYRTTTLTMKEICESTGINLRAFRNHMHSWHKNLLFERRGATLPADVSDRLKLTGVKRYSPAVSKKYASAIDALRKGEKSVEEIAREYGFTPEVFRAYLKEHHYDLWEKMGMTELSNGKKVLRRSSEKYAEAIELYRTTTESLKSIAQRLKITYNSIGGFIRRNMPEIIEEHNRLLSSQTTS